MTETGMTGRPTQPFDSRQLLVFLNTARTNSVAVAARAINVSPSAVSHSLRALEDEIGEPLFNRIGKKMILTPAGEHLLHYAERILANMDKARVSLGQRAEWGKGRLRVAAVDSICQYFIPSVLAGFYKDFPDVPISVTVADTRQCIEAIRQQRADLAIAIAPSQAEALEMQPLFADELHWIVSPTHPWALNDQFRPGDIASQRLVFSAASSHTFRLVEKYYERDNLHLKPAVELDNYEATKEMVKAGHGITVMATWMAGKELADGTLVALPLGRHKLKRNWCILQSPDSRAGLAEEVFSRHCHQTALSFGASPVRQSLAKKFIHASCAAILLISDWASSVGDLLCLTGAV